MRRVSFLLLLLVVHLAAGEPIPIITGNTIVHDLTVRIGHDRFVVACLLRPEVEPHAYQPVPEDMRRLESARLVIINGLGFEGWFDALAREARFAGTLVVAAAGVPTMDMPGTQVADPHPFNSIRQGVRYVENIRDALCAADPAGAAGIRERASQVIDELRRTDAWATAQLAAIPKAQRRIVTHHDALAYFARDYGFDILAPNSALEDGEPSARQVADLIAFIRAQGVRGVFLESGSNPRLIEQIAAEAGVRVGGTLYLDGLGPQSAGADSYVGMFRRNVTTILEALR